MIRKIGDGVGTPTDESGRVRGKPDPANASRLPGDDAGTADEETRARPMTRQKPSGVS